MGREAFIRDIIVLAIYMYAILFSIYGINAQLPFKNTCMKIGETYTLWSKTWGGTFTDEGISIAVSEYDEIYITGYSTGYIGGYGEDIIVLKYDCNGNLLWNVSWDGGDYERGYGIAISNESVVVVGYGGATSGTDIILLKFNTTNGALLWSRTLDINEYDEGISVTTSDVGDIFVVGRTYVCNESCNWDLIVLKYNSEGTLLWNKSWGGPYDDIGRDIDISQSGDIFVVGDSGGFDNSAGGITLLKFNKYGELLWNKTYLYGSGHGIKVTNTSLYITGSVHGNETNSIDILTMKCDLNGTVEWMSVWGCERYRSASEYGYAVDISAKGDVYISGCSLCTKSGANDIILLKLNRYGELIWSYLWGGDNGDWGYDLALFDEYIYVVGSTISYSQTDDPDSLVIKFDGRDSDNDGLCDSYEISIGTDPLDQDTDDDNMPDGWEVQYQLDPLRDDASEDPDFDGWTNIEEYMRGTNPRVFNIDGPTGITLMIAIPCVIVIALVIMVIIRRQKT